LALSRAAGAFWVQGGDLMGSKKGNLVVGQSGGPTAVINNSLVGVIHEALEQPNIGEIYGMLHGIAGILNEEFIDLRRESRHNLELLRNTPASALGTVRYKVTDADYERILQVFMAYDVRYFFYIGGNDSMDTTHKMHRLAQEKGYELHAIGVPKTVDNDLAQTDHCPGYGSAARFVASAIRNTGYDTQAMGDSGPIKMMEIMGRNAGWLTAAAALARTEPQDPPHLVYVPEHGVSPEQVLSDVRRCLDDYGFCVAAVSEGLRSTNGVEFGTVEESDTDVDAFGHARKGGVVDHLAELIKADTGITVRLDKPGYLQRSFAEMMSLVDREEAYQAGRSAVRVGLGGESGKMVTFVRQPGPQYAIEMGLAPLEKVANFEKMLPAHYVNAAGNDVTEAFVEYAAPLIGEPLTRYGRLAAHLVPKRVL
jgi:6-phosphofructokinase 1